MRGGNDRLENYHISGTLPHRTIFQDLAVIISNKHFMAATLGLAANNFALGGLADWFSSFAIRYLGSSLAEAGLVIGFITVVAGISGNILGSQVAQYYEARFKSAFFLVPALFTLPGCLFLVLALNLHVHRWVVYALLLISETFLWTMLAPLSALSINVVEPSLRARAMGFAICVQHLLGDVISPPIIGVISDNHGLKAGLQVTWAAILVSAAWWYSGYACLSALKVSEKFNSEASPTILSLLLNWKVADSGGDSGDLMMDPLAFSNSMEVRDATEMGVEMVCEAGPRLVPSWRRHRLSPLALSDDQGEDLQIT
jgi:MFS family permease